MTKAIVRFLIALTAVVAIGCTVPTPDDDTGDTGGGKPGGKDTGDLGTQNTNVVIDYSFDGALDPDLTISDAVQTDGRDGQGFAFDGYEQYLSLPDSSSLTLATDGSLEAWIYAYSHSSFAGILHKGVMTDFSDEAYSLQFWGDNGQLALWIYNEAGDTLNLKSLSLLEAGQWHHVVATWDAAEVRLYVDGELDNMKANTIGAIRDTDGDLIIGAQLPVPYNDNYGHIGFHGVIDDVRVLSEAIESTEVAQRYADMIP